MHFPLFLKAFFLYTGKTMPIINMFYLDFNTISVLAKFLLGKSLIVATIILT